jgi:hypothetical protein
MLYGPNEINVIRTDYTFTELYAPGAYQPAPLNTTAPGEAPAAAGLDPGKFAELLYGKPIPVFLGGKALIGCRIIEGPFIDNTNVKMVVAAAMAAAPNGTREIWRMRANGAEVWNSASGSMIAGLTIDTRPGTETQLPFAMSTARFAGAAIAYRPLIMASIELDVAQFNNEIPFFSMLVAESTFGDPDDGVSYVDAIVTFAKLAGFDADEIDTTGITGSEKAFIVEKEQTIIEWLNELRRLHPDWSILTNDKLRVTQREPDDPVDFTLTRAKVLSNGSKPITGLRMDPLTVPREENYRFIDADRDYEPSVVTARRERDPIPSTQSRNSLMIDLPIVSTASLAIEQINQALYAVELAREKTAFVGKLELIGAEPGDTFTYTTGSRVEVHRITETGGNANWTIDVKAEGYLTHALPGDIGASTGIPPGDPGTAGALLAGDGALAANATSTATGFPILLPGIGALHVNASGTATGLSARLAGAGAFAANATSSLPVTPTTFSGALVKRTADQTGANYTTQAAIPFDAEVYDTDNWHDNVTNNTRLTVPSGVNYAMLWGQVWMTGFSASQFALEIHKNGVIALGCGSMVMTYSGTSQTLTIGTAPIPVSPGDYFELKFSVATDTTINIESELTCFSARALG